MELISFTKYLQLADGSQVTIVRGSLTTLIVIALILLFIWKIFLPWITDLVMKVTIKAAEEKAKHYTTIVDTITTSLKDKQ